jgi:CHAT domain-containing protein/Tfp pilus assembly protein PilF
VAPCVTAIAAPTPDCDGVPASVPPAFETVATLRGKEQQRWDVRLPANSPVVVSVAEDGLDLTLEVARDGDGQGVGRAESPISRHGTERVVFVTAEARGYVVTVSGKEHPDASGRAAVRVTVMRDPASSFCRAIFRELAAGDASFVTGQYEAAAGSYRKAATLLKDSPPSLLAQAQHAEAAVFNRSLQDWVRAKASASNAALSYEKAGDATGRARARLIEAEARIELAAPKSSAGSAGTMGNELAKVRDDLEEIAQFHAKRGEKYDEAIALNDIGVAFYHDGQFDDALRLFRRTVPLYGALQEKPREALVLQNIATVEYELGRLSEAIAHYQDLRTLLRREDNPVIFALVMNNSGIARSAAGDHDGALRDLGEALSSAKEAQVKYHQAVALHNIGRVYDSLGDQDRALDYYQQALQLRAADSDPTRRAGSLRAIGNVLRERGKLDEALKMHREALALSSVPSARARVLLLIARDLGEMGQAQQALRELDPILAPPGLDDEVVRARALAIRGQYASSGAVAERDLRDAVATFRRYELPADEFDAWLALARSLRQAGKPDAAMNAVDKALALAEEVRLQSANPELRATLMQPLQPAFDLKISMLAEQYFASNDKARERIARLALGTAERSRSRALADFQTLDVSAPDVPPELVQERKRTYRELAARRFGLASSLERKGTGDVHVQTISADIAQLRRQLDEIDARIGAASAKATSTSSSGARSPKDTRTLPADTAVVEYWLGREDAIVWVTTQDSVVMARLGTTATITGAARSFYDALRNFGSVPEERRLALGARLHELVIDPVGPQVLANRRLIFVPDGALHYIPFAALRTGTASNGKFLIETHDISSAPSLEMLLNRAPASREPASARQMLVVADPVYTLDDLRLGTRAEPRTMTERPAPWPLSLLTRGPQGEGYLARLPGSAREAATIASVFPQGSVDRLEGFSATRERFLNAGLGRYQFIHIATHAIADSDVPQASALLFSRFDNRAQELDGRVLAADFINVQLNAQTVVLSACDTAMGKNISGEGLMGLRYVVLARGARAVVASMWPVADQVSAELMARFYRTLLQEQRRVGPALSDAMRVAITGRFKDPGLWAAYALTVGDLDGI